MLQDLHDYLVSEKKDPLESVCLCDMRHWKPSFLVRHHRCSETERWFRPEQLGPKIHPRVAGLPEQSQDAWTQSTGPGANKLSSVH